MPLGWIVTQPPTTGFVEGTIKKVSAQFQGGQPHEGPLVSQFKKIIGSLAGATPHAGPIASETKKLTGQLNGLQSQVGTIGGTLGKVRGQIDQASVNGALNGSVLKVLASLTGNQIINGQIAGQFQKPVAQAQGLQVYTGTLQSELKRAIASLAGNQSMTGTISSELKKVIADVVGNASVAAVEVSSTGPGAIIDSVGNTRTITYDHVSVAGPNQRMMIVAACGHNTWVNPTMTCTATRGGSAVSGITLVQRVDYGNDSGNRLGHIVIWELVAPVAGTYTFTITASASQGIHRLVGNSRVYNNVGFTNGLVTQAATSTNAALSLSATPDVGDMVLFGSALNDPAVNAVFSPSATPWYSGALARTGDLDVWDFRDFAGTGAVINYTTDTSQKLGAFGIVLKKA